MIKKGMIFKCPSCKEKAVEAVEDIPNGTMVKAAHFKGIQGVDLISNCKVQCYACGDDRDFARNFLMAGHWSEEK